MSTHIGIDFGARYAGTTALCFASGNTLHFIQARKKQDADDLCRRYISELKPDFVMIDAPLSLPFVYRGTSASSADASADFFFRHADRQLNAMSPMFLGGLTARAMQLASYFTPAGIPFFETWPTRIRHCFGSDQRPEPEALNSQISKVTGLGLIHDSRLTRHGIDSVLAWYAGWLKINGKLRAYGYESEGLIWC